MAKRIDWTPHAKADLRRIAQPEALQVLKAIASYAKSGLGDVKRLSGANPPKSRLRVGNYRVIFRDNPSHIELLAVGDRKEVYRH